MKQVTVSELENAISFGKNDYESKNIPFDREIESFDTFLRNCVDATNHNNGSLKDAIEIAETNFNSL
jgi:hypothetical protein